MYRGVPATGGRRARGGPGRAWRREEGPSCRGRGGEQCRAGARRQPSTVSRAPGRHTAIVGFTDETQRHTGDLGFGLETFGRVAESLTPSNRVATLAGLDTAICLESLVRGGIFPVHGTEFSDFCCPLPLACFAQTAIVFQWPQTHSLYKRMRNFRFRTPCGVLHRQR